MGKIGIRSRRNVGEIYSQKKSERICLSLTLEGLRGLNQLAIDYGISRQELIERIGRGLLQLRISLPDTHDNFT